MGRGGGRNPKNCVGFVKDIIQAAEFACYGSLQNCHTDCNKRDKSVMVDTTRMNHYIDIIAGNSNCTAELQKVDNKKPQYRLCKSMAKRIDDVIDAYVPPVPVIPETRRRYSLRSLGLAEDNFNLVTGGDDFDADNDNEAVLARMTAAEILEGGDAAVAGMAGTATTDGMADTSTETTEQQQQPTQKKKRRGHLTTFVDAVTVSAEPYRYPFLALKRERRKKKGGVDDD